MGFLLAKKANSDLLYSLAAADFRAWDIYLLSDSYFFSSTWLYSKRALSIIVFYVGDLT